MHTANTTRTHRNMCVSKGTSCPRPGLLIVTSLHYFAAVTTAVVAATAAAASVTQVSKTKFTGSCKTLSCCRQEPSTAPPDCTRGVRPEGTPRHRCQGRTPHPTSARHEVSSHAATCIMRQGVWCQGFEALQHFALSTTEQSLSPSRELCHVTAPSQTPHYPYTPPRILSPT